jgi:hypothetical protein
MKAKRQTRKAEKKEKAKTKRRTTRKPQKTWQPTNYLLEPHPELGIPEC